MTRYTFVLIVCRTIGALSIMYLVQMLVYACENTTWALRAWGASEPGIYGFPFLTIGLALVTAGAGVFAGRYAIRISESVDRRFAGEISPRLTALGVASVICAVEILEYLDSAQLGAIHEWALSGMSSRFKAIDQASPWGSQHYLLMAGAFLVCLVALLFAAFARPKTEKDYS